MVKSKYDYLLVIGKVLVFIAALYLAYVILRPLLNILLGISFWLIKLIIFIVVAIVVIHIFLKLIFGIDLMARFLKG